MIQTLSRNWWLLALCGVLEALSSVTYIIMPDGDGALTLRKYALKATIVFLGELALAAGACTLTASLWRAKDKCWLLVLNGLALSVLGLLFLGVLGPRVSFRSIANLLVVMALSAGILELALARDLRRAVIDQWFLRLAGAASVAYALAFLWIKPAPGAHSDFLWIGSYFGFSAICMLWLALRLPGLGHSQSGQWEALPRLGNPKHAL